MNKVLLGAALALSISASAAKAEILEFTITNDQGILVETFTLDEDAGQANSFPDFLFFNLLSSSLGNDSAFFGSFAVFNSFGTGFQRPGENSVATTFNDNANATLFSGTGLRLNFTSGTTFTTNLGNTVVVSSAAAVPEPGTWAMMLVGFGAVGGAMRSARRKQKVTVTFG